MKIILTTLALANILLVATSRGADLTTHHALTMNGAKKVAEAVATHAKANDAAGNIVHEGQVVGAIGVSGAKSAQQDEDVAKAGAAALTETRTASK